MIRYYYPYCGWQLGFCKSDNGCTMYDGQCLNYIENHPVHGQPPVMLGLDGDLRDIALLGYLKEVIEEEICL